MKFDRRAALRMLALSAGGGVLPWWAPRRVAADPGQVPLRLLILDVGTGVLRGSWEPDAPEEGPAILRGSEWNFRGPHSVYAPYKSRATVFQNLDMKTAKEDPTPGDNAHINGHTHQLTATFRPTGQGALGGGESIDQFIARSLNQPRPVTRLPSLELTTGRSNQRGASYAASEQPIPFEREAEEVWNRVFPSDDGDAAGLARRRSQVSDFVKGDYDRLLTALGAEDRAKIQQMQDLRRDLEVRRTTLSPRANRRPSESILEPYQTLGRDVHDAEHYEQRVEVMTKLAAAALYADATRVVTLRIDRPPDDRFGYSKGRWGTRDWHDLDHKVSGNNRDRDLSDPVQAVDLITTMQRLYAEKAKAALDELASLEETDGQSLLDHTLVLVTSHIADGSHDITRLPWLVFGDGHGAFRTDQYLRFLRTWKDDRPPSFSGDQWRSRGRPHNDLFTSLAQAMGIAVDRFGEASVATGPIEEMRA